MRSSMPRRTGICQDTRAGHYQRKLHTKAGEVTLNMPKLRKLPFETAIVERYRRREASVEETALGHAGEQSQPEDLQADRGLAKPPDRR